MNGRRASGESIFSGRNMTRNDLLVWNSLSAMGTVNLKFPKYKKHLLVSVPAYQRELICVDELPKFGGVQEICLVSRKQMAHIFKDGLF